MAPRVSCAWAAISSSEALATPLSWKTASAASRMRLRVSWASSLVRRTIARGLHGLDIHTCLYVNCAREQEACKAPTRNKPMSTVSPRLRRASALFAPALLLAACGGGQAHPGGPGAGGGMPPIPVAVEEVRR